LAFQKLDVDDVVGVKTMLYIFELLFVSPLLLTYHAVYGMEIKKHVYVYSSSYDDFVELHHQWML